MAMSKEAKELLRKYNREYRAKNIDRIRAYEREWRKNNPDKVKASLERYWERRAKKLAEQAKEKPSERSNNNGCNNQ